MAMQPTTFSFCKALPKVELHAHLNGSLSVRTLKELGCLDIPAERYTKLTSILNKDRRALDECLQLFKVAHDATNNKHAVYIATKRVIEDFAFDNVMYLELRTTPRSVGSMTKQDYVEAVIKGIKENDMNITVKLILSINRSHDAQYCQDSLQTILKMKTVYPDIIKGICLSGDPHVGKFEEEIFKTAKENGLSTTIHCAEVKNDEEVKQILKFNPDRIGHATFLHPKYGGCQENWELYCEKKIPVESCITSNVFCEATPSYQHHHIQEWITNKLPYCISTDNTGVFVTCLSKEYQYMHDFYDLTREDLWQVALNSVDFSFASDAEKLRLKTKLEQWKKDNENMFK